MSSGPYSWPIPKVDYLDMAPKSSMSRPHDSAPPGQQKCLSVWMWMMEVEDEDEDDYDYDDDDDDDDYD